MPNTRGSPDVHQAYDKLVFEYNRKGDRKSENAHLERPATLSLLPGVTKPRFSTPGVEQDISHENSPIRVRTSLGLT